MLYRICDQLVILVRFRHLNGNLKLAGSGNGIDLWGVSWWHMTLTVSGQWAMGLIYSDVSWGAWLDRGYRIDLWGHAMGTHITGWIGAMQLNHGICDTGWIGAMGLIYGGVWHWLNGVMGLIQGGLAIGGTRHWLDQGDGIDLWDVPWGMQHGLDWGDGIDLWDTSWAHDWIGKMGLIWGATPLGCDTGWDMSWGRNWIKEMGLISGGTPWGCDTGWMWMMRLIYGGIPWGRATGLGRWNWFVEGNHGGAWHWLDLGEGIDLYGHVMRARHEGPTLAGLGLWNWFMVACWMPKYYTVAEFEWRYHVSYVWR